MEKEEIVLSLLRFDKPTEMVVVLFDFYLQLTKQSSSPMDNSDTKSNRHINPHYLHQSLTFAKRHSSRLAQWENFSR